MSETKSSTARIYLLFALLLGVVGFNSWFLLHNFESVRENQSWLTHTRVVITEIDSTALGVREAESAQRAYILTHDDDYLKTFHVGLVNAKTHLLNACALTVDNPVQKANCPVMTSLVEDRLQHLSTLIKSAQYGKIPESVIRRTLTEGKSLMDAVVTQMGRMKGEELRLLESRTRDTEQARSLFFMTLVLTTALTMVVLVYAFFQLRGNHGRAQSELRDQTRESSARENIAEISRIVAGDQPFPVVSHEALAYLGRRFGIVAAKLYIREHHAFRLVASLGIDNVQDTTSISESNLLSQAAAQEDVVLINNVPGDYWKFSTTLGEAPPTSLAFAPILFQGRSIGVIEFASFEPLTTEMSSLFRRIGETLGVGLNAGLSRERLQSLLSETQQQAEELQSQQEELRVNNEELEQQARALESQQESLATKNRDLEIVQDDLKRKADDLERSSQYKSEFLAKMSHELRTPLNGLLILSTLLIENKEKNLTDQQKQFARSIQSAGNDLLTLINDILDLAKVEAKKLTVRKETFTIGSLFSQMKLTFEPQTKAKNLGLKTDVSSELENFAIYTDRQRLEQILRNFLSNAVKFTENGQIEMRANVDRRDRMIEITVADTGIGVAENKRGLIFEAFEQADSSTSRNYGGTGLGLTISRELANLLGGEIKLKSDEGKGSEFTIRLPFDAQPSPQASSEPVEQERPRSQGPMGIQPNEVIRAKTVSLPKLAPDAKTILIVEDDDAFRQSIVEVTKSYGFTPIEAADGESALAILDQHAPSAILLDIKLPGISGLGILEMIKQMPHLRHIPVHMISGLEHQQSALRMGALGYLTKPVTLDKVRSAIGRMESLLSEKVRKVLLIEDDERQNLAIAELVSGQDVAVTSVRTGKEAIETVQKQAFDCIILDLSLPDFSGFDLLKQLNGLSISLPPIVIYTGKDLSAEEESYLRRFSESIIIKGARSPERLLDEVNLFLHRVESLLPHEKQQMLTHLRSQDQSFENRTVLLVDDDVRNLFALTSVLETRGLKVRFAKDGIAALEELEKHDDIELVLMDIMMPRMDGLEATRRIRTNKNDRVRGLPIIALTAKAMKDDHEKCIEAGATDYLPKPINLDNLMTVLKVWLTPKHLFN
jgi:CheY-like chemotaxis protein/CHASE3 domain sensor protein